MIQQWLRTRLAYRSAASILILVGLLGILFVLLTLKLVSDQEQNRQAEQLVGLLDTVDNTLRIAVFLADKQLAGEVI
ncbi:MAG: hypothetical protein GWN58_63630, partial [Anaerolineae bacterium]|nr:hypothetical protein [Anaerolineae bacterium]